MTAMIKTTVHLNGTETIRLVKLESAESNHVTLAIDLDRLSELRLVLPAGIGGYYGGNVENHNRAINWLRKLSSEAAHLADHLEATRWHPAHQGIEPTLAPTRDSYAMPRDCEAAELS